VFPKQKLKNVPHDIQVYTPDSEKRVEAAEDWVRRILLLVARVGAVHKRTTRRRARKFLKFMIIYQIN